MLLRQKSLQQIEHLCPKVMFGTRTLSEAEAPVFCLNCCSFLTSVSKAWKSIESRATIEFTSSILESTWVKK